MNKEHEMKSLLEMLATVRDMNQKHKVEDERKSNEKKIILVLIFHLNQLQ